MRDKRIMNTTPKNMNELYNNTDTCRVVKTGEWHNVRYWITTIGMHPCAYVECTEEFLDAHQDTYDLIEGIYVHGGVTFGGRLDLLRAFQSEDVENVIAFGWDYGHCDDWMGFHSDEDNYRYGCKKWGIDEIELECHNAINMYLELLEEDKNKADETKLVILKNQYLQEMADDEIDLKPYFTPGEYEIKTFESKEERDGYIKAVNDFQLDVKVIYGEKLKKVTL